MVGTISGVFQSIIDIDHQEKSETQCCTELNDFGLISSE